MFIGEEQVLEPGEVRDVRLELPRGFKWGNEVLVESHDDQGDWGVMPALYSVRGSQKGGWYILARMFNACPDKVGVGKGEVAGLVSNQFELLNNCQGGRVAGWPPRERESDEERETRRVTDGPRTVREEQRSGRPWNWKITQS